MFKALDRIVELELSLNKQSRLPISRVNTANYLRDAAELERLTTDLLTSVSLDGIKNYHRLVRQKIQTYQQENQAVVTEYDAKIRDYEQRLAQAERDKIFTGRLNAEQSPGY